MSETHRTFAGSVPENYQRYLVPLIFEDYAADLADRVPADEGLRLLETACGTGVVTRHLLARLPTGSTVTATDLNSGMIDQARAQLGEPEGLTLQTADATDLPFADGSFDAVVCQFGVMFFPDRQKGFEQAARVLRPGGRYLFNVWDSLDHNRLIQAVHEAVAGLYPDDPPDFLTLPYGTQDLIGLVRGLQAAGFGPLELTVQPRQSRAPRSRDVALGVCSGSPLANQLAERPQLSQAQVIDAVERALTAEFGPGPLSAPMQAIQITARKTEP